MREIRGYSNVYGVTIWHCDQLMCINHGAFDRWLAEARHQVPVLFGGHDLPPIATTTLIFEDEFGLGFSAALDMAGDPCNWARLQAITRATNPVDQASGTMIVRDSYIDSRGVEHITRAELEDVAIVSRGAWSTTAVWLAGVDLDAAPYKIQDRAARWEIGHRGFTARQRSKMLPPPPPSPELEAPRRDASSHAVRMSDERQANLASVRREWMRFATNGMIVGHAAFSRAAFGQAGLTPPWERSK